jgi:RNA polymerase sigma-70 factor, ECF subfamily
MHENGLDLEFAVVDREREPSTTSSLSGTDRRQDGPVRDEAGFRAFVETNGATLLHAARLLTGDHHRGEDLVQTALTKVYLKWGKIDAPLPYARKALVNAHIDQTRRKWWGERSTEVLPEPPVLTGEVAASDLRDELRRMLSGLSPRDRAVVVMRYYCDLSEQDTAATLGLAIGTVKSSCARALARLRVEATSAAGGGGR